MRSCLIIAFILISALEAVSKEIRVCINTKNGSVAEAVTQAQPHDRIIIEEGVYKERNIIVDKPLIIIGEGYPTIDGGDGGDILIIRSDSVSIQGLKIINSGFSSIKDYAGIKIEKSSECTIRDNELNNNYFAVYLSDSKNCSIINNKITGNAIRESNSGNGIHLWKCNAIVIENNHTLSHRDGIYLEFSTSCSVKNNLSKGNLRYGLHFMFSHGNSYVSNRFTQNGAGVAVMYTKDVEMVDNIFEENWGPTAYGLLLKDITNSVICGNKFHRNTTGIFMEAARSVTLTGNQFSGNGWAIRLMGNSVENKISGNNFIGNTFDVVTNSFETGNQNYTSENYWDKYKGYDLNKDNKGDVPFRPVSLFSVYVEKIPYSIVLLRSFIADLLETIERAVPAVIPETLVDDQPVMQKISL